MANDADPLAIDFRKRQQQVHRADVVPDRFHAAASELRLSKVVRVLAEGRIVGGERDVAALCQLLSVVQISGAGESHRLILSFLDSLMQTEHCGMLLPVSSRWDKQPGGDAVEGVALKAQSPADEL